MKHCKNCEYCRLDMVAQYIKGLEIYKCDRDGTVINNPFWKKCEQYQKNTFRKLYRGG